ncbi:uncharacterized protein LOC132738350, partial [Ruditapes philippinarum]|uniref:uncharacterized protein LOC132738350 n=1 Tax=Ruditapes philippinarum TaxID=129788 RepID=UPI00295AFAFD
MTSIGVNGSSSSTDGLPKQFVTSLRILFDILDEERTGYVRLRDIESRWHEEGVSGLPSGVIDTLRKVAPRNGRLTFENFVTGLKLSLLKNTGANFKQDTSQRRREIPQQNTHKQGPGAGNVNLQTENLRPAQPPDYENIVPTERMRADRILPNQSVYSGQRTRPKMGSQVISSNTSGSNTATVRPNNVLQSQNIELRNQIYTRDQTQQAAVKTHVKPEHSRITDDRNQNVRPSSFHPRHSTDGNQVRKEHTKIPYRPKSALAELQRPKEVNFSDVPVSRPDRPPPYRRPQERESDAAPVLPPKDMNGRIMNELKNWQKDQQISPPGHRGKLHTVHSDSKLSDQKKHEIYVNIDQIRKHEASQQGAPAGTGGTRKPVRRQNSRRHTLSSGIDYNVIRRMKQLEQEKDVLLQGLEVVERARDWYHKQISVVTDKQNYAEKTSCSDVTLQSQQERMDFVRSRITDVNMNLKTLMQTS